MRRAQQLLSRASKPNDSFGAAMGGTRPFSNALGFRARNGNTYDVSWTVLEIDAADNKHVKPLPISKADNKDVKPLSISRASWMKSAPPMPNGHKNSDQCKPGQLENKPEDMLSEEAAPWVNDNPEYYSQFLSTSSSREDPAAREQAKEYMRIIDTALERLDRSETQLSFGFIALGLGMSTLAGRKVGRFIEEAKRNRYTFDLRKESDDKFELSLNGDLNGTPQRMIVTRHLGSIRTLIRSSRISKETESMRDLVENRKQ